MTAPFVNDLDLTASRLHEAVELLIAHQRAVSAGDEDRADALLADLERPLRRLSWAQNEWLRGLSGDLQMLSGEEVHEPNRQPQDDYRRALQITWANAEDDPKTLLALLRKEQNFLPDDRTAIGRARAYGALGFPHLFWTFAQYAVQRASDKALPESFMLDQLKAEGRRSEALELGRLLLADPNSPPFAVLGAANVLHNAADLLAEDEARQLLGKVRRTVESLIRPGTSTALDVEDVVTGMILLAQVCAKLGRRADTVKWYRQAIALSPDDADPYVGLGLFLYHEDRSQALRYLAEAVRRRVELSSPYLFLAEVALMSGRYDECLSLVDRAMDFVDAPRLTAAALELAGLARLRQVGPTDEVLRLLREAAECDAQDDSLRRNLDVAQEARRSQDTAGAARRQSQSYTTLGNAPVIPDDVRRMDMARLADVSKRASQQVHGQWARAA